MRKMLLIILTLVTIGMLNVKAQLKEIHLGDTLVVIERLTLTEADDKKVDRIKSAQADGIVSGSWKVDDFRKNDKRLEEDYERIISGLKKKGIKFKELNRQEFSNHLILGTEKVVYLINDYSVREEKNFLIITRTFKLLTSDKKVLLDEPATGILKQISGT